MVCFLNAATSCARFSSGVSSLGFSLGFCAAIAFHLGRRRRIGDLALMGHGRAPDHVVFHVMMRLAVLLGRQVGHHVTDVGRVKRRGLRGHPAGEVGIADDHNAIVGDTRFVHLRQLAVAAALGGKVDDDRTRLHHLDHVLGPELGRRAVGDEGRGDDDVDIGRHLAEFLKLLGLEFRADGAA
jgi:hypothetical protein